jgi:hypothetical protein
MPDGTVPTEVGRTVIGHFEPFVTHQFLPGCRLCGTKHPAAYMPPLDTNLCPGCGTLVAPPGEKVTVGSTLTLWGAIGNGLMKIGVALARLSQRI